MACPEYDPGPGRPEKLGVKVAHTDREGHGDTALCLPVRPHLEIGSLLGLHRPELCVWGEEEDTVRRALHTQEPWWACHLLVGAPFCCFLSHGGWDSISVELKSPNLTFKCPICAKLSLLLLYVFVYVLFSDRICWVAPLIGFPSPFLHNNKIMLRCFLTSYGQFKERSFQKPLTPHTSQLCLMDKYLTLIL